MSKIQQTDYILVELLDYKVLSVLFSHYVDVCDTTVWSLELLYPGNIIDNLHWSEIILETTLFSLQSINGEHFEHLSFI